MRKKLNKKIEREEELNSKIGKNKKESLVVAKEEVKSSG